MQGYSTKKVCRVNGRQCTYDSECWRGCCDVDLSSIVGSLATSYGGLQKTVCQSLTDQNILGVVYKFRTSCRPNPNGKKPFTASGCWAFYICLIIILPILAGCACIAGLIYWIYTCTCKKKSVQQPVVMMQQQPSMVQMQQQYPQPQFVQRGY